MDDTAQDPQKAYNAGGRFKEQLEAIAGGFSGGSRETEATRVEEVPANVEEEKLKEAEGYIEKVEKEAELGKPVVDDYTKQVLVAAAVPQKPKVTLPLTDDQIKKGLHHKIWEGIRWLAEWCLRQLKMVR
ncbi:MAG: hypothetical protein UX99_C0020G0011 [Candidatus Amesbacteria bacterium GW2011_GWB1_47_26]|uniref:Uncharacterized protein n=1 Tax=Candidatus Amesbacteria bacterium GW2011_GWC2_45_19 TaxID=1618366 RepID=A0A0G1M3L9_9BACT|nr:MAG: hypothetical protein UX05_C0006G0029 [Candidatus Amesbacteria bacterium GW2011_GWC2_45_19]KKU37507.1 MAG: hypothetical protein UX52_C0024G0011 [Candidatus Amesbacteria bacterium GW2011_GWA1_46_35]KKU74242.1 MAG: hypothetical protein UX99_C0020G0011 [Candidatus Amesbacteria bacterium GW2011_GWB1_47_26]